MSFLPRPQTTPQATNHQQNHTSHCDCSLSQLDAERTRPTRTIHSPRRFESYNMSMSSSKMVPTGGRPSSGLVQPSRLSLPNRRETSGETTLVPRPEVPARGKSPERGSSSKVVTQLEAKERGEEGICGTFG